MRHKIKTKKLNRTSSHRSAMLANMASSLVMNEQIKTTLPKAKVLRQYLEKLVTKAKKANLSSIKNIISIIKDKQATDKLIKVLGTRYSTRPGGYLRIIKAGFRYGDRAPLAYIEFVDRDLLAKGSLTPRIEKNSSELNQEVE